MELMVVSQEERELGSVPGWLAELRRMRGGALYNRGWPFFRASDGTAPSMIPKPTISSPINCDSRQWISAAVGRKRELPIGRGGHCLDRHPERDRLRDGNPRPPQSVWARAVNLFAGRLPQIIYSTFDSNGAVGGNGTGNCNPHTGGGGDLSGNGGLGDRFVAGFESGGGGGGSRGEGGQAFRAP